MGTHVPAGLCNSRECNNAGLVAGAPVTTTCAWRARGGFKLAKNNRLQCSAGVSLLQCNAAQCEKNEDLPMEIAGPREKEIRPTRGLSGIAIPCLPKSKDYL